MFEVFALIGRERSCARLRAAGRQLVAKEAVGSGPLAAAQS